LLGGFLSPLNEGDAGCGGRGTFEEGFFAQEGVQESRFSRVEFTRNDDQEKLIELENGFLEAVEGFSGKVKIRQSKLNSSEGFFFFSQELGLLVCENRLAHEVLLILFVYSIT